MKFPLRISALIFLSGILCFLGACGGRTDANANTAADRAANVSDNGNLTKDDVQELGKIINLPFEPDDSAVWRETNIAADSEAGTPSQTQRKLVAVLKFDPDQTTEIIKKAEQHRPSIPAELDAESWFPAELIAQSQAAGDATLKGNSYAANDFVKTPYTDGKLTRIVNTDYFVLELTSF